MTTSTLRFYGSVLSEMPSLRAAALVLSALAASLFHLGAFFLALVALLAVHSVVARRQAPKNVAEAVVVSSLPAIALFLLAAASSLYLEPLRDAVAVFGRVILALVSLGGSLLVFTAKLFFVRVVVMGIIHPRIRLLPKSRAKEGILVTRMTVACIVAMAVAILLSPLVLRDGLSDLLTFFVEEFLQWKV